MSFLWGERYYTPCMPELTAMMGSEIHAVLLQAFLSALIGMGFAGGSVIWEMDDWGLLRQTILYFLITSVTMMPIAYIAHWMEHSVRGIFIYFGIFASIYVILWIILYFTGRHNVRKLNETLRRRQNSELS